MRQNQINSFNLIINKLSENQIKSQTQTQNQHHQPQHPPFHSLPSQIQNQNPIRHHQTQTQSQSQTQTRNQNINENKNKYKYDDKEIAKNIEDEEYIIGFYDFPQTIEPKDISNNEQLLSVCNGISNDFFLS